MGRREKTQPRVGTSLLHALAGSCILNVWLDGAVNGKTQPWALEPTPHLLVDSARNKVLCRFENMRKYISGFWPLGTERFLTTRIAQLDQSMPILKIQLLIAMRCPFPAWCKWYKPTAPRQSIGVGFLNEGIESCRSADNMHYWSVSKGSKLEPGALFARVLLVFRH